MFKYTQTIEAPVVYSIGDTHGCGRQVIEFMQRLEVRAILRNEPMPVVVQLGDLCDGFAMPQDASSQNLRALCYAYLETIPELKSMIMHEGNHFVNWSREDGLRGELSGLELIEHPDHDVLVATYQAFRAFETLMLYSAWQMRHPEQFYVVLGNHDADIVRGKCAYGRQQKYILLGLLGLSPAAVISHMTTGWTRRILRHPWLRWLSTRPHIVASKDTLYMHGGPTTALCEQFASGALTFKRWCRDLDNARAKGFLHPAFTEHTSFLSPDGGENDWFNHPERITQFLDAANYQYLVVGHSPFLDFDKNHILDLTQMTDEVRNCLVTPGLLAPNGRLIKHDTDMKRIGQLWVCKHEIRSNAWTAFDAQFNEVPLRTHF